jgi:hypothetical protein
MRFVEIKTEAQQAAACLHKVREMLVKQRTMWINHLRGMMAEFGTSVAEGAQHTEELLAILGDPKEAASPNWPTKRCSRPRICYAQCSRRSKRWTRRLSPGGVRTTGI